MRNSRTAHSRLLTFFRIGRGRAGPCVGANATRLVSDSATMALHVVDNRWLSGRVGRGFHTKTVPYGPSALTGYTDSQSWSQ